MPDEKIDQKRPIDADHEPKPLQQRHVDDTVDDSFPASDPPAWTTSASKSVAAECEPDALNEPPTPPGRGLEGKSASTGLPGTEQVYGLARDLYERGQSYLEEGRRYLPEATRYYRQGTEVVSRPMQEHPLATVLAIGALGCALGWMLGRRTTSSAPTRQWYPEFDPHSTRPQHWRPSARSTLRRDHLPSSYEAEAASHTNNSF